MANKGAGGNGALNNSSPVLGNQNSSLTFHLPADYLYGVSIPSSLSTVLELASDTFLQSRTPAIGRGM